MRLTVSNALVVNEKIDREVDEQFIRVHVMAQAVAAEFFLSSMLPSGRA